MTTLAQGDIAIVEYHSDTGPDRISFVLLTDIDATTTINFTETGFTSAGAFQTSEGGVSWTSGTAVSAGTVIRLVDTTTSNILDTAQNASTGATLGTVANIGDGFSPNSAGDQVFVYQGALASNGSNLLYGANFGEGDDPNHPIGADGWNTNVTTDSQASALPSSISNPLYNFGAFVGPGQTEIDNGIYTGPMSGTQTDILTNIANLANWTLFDVADPTPNVISAFTVSTPSNPPTLDTNTGSSLNEGALDVVAVTELETNDTDTADSALVYTLDTATANGSLWVDADGSGTINNAEAAIGVGGTFAQQNIASGQLKYQHNGSDTTSDSFQFDVSDGPNSIDNQTFNFTISPINDLPVVSGSMEMFLPTTRFLAGP